MINIQCCQNPCWPLSLLHLLSLLSNHDHTNFSFFSTQCCSSPFPVISDLCILMMEETTSFAIRHCEGSRKCRVGFSNTTNYGTFHYCRHVPLFRTQGHLLFVYLQAIWPCGSWEPTQYNIVAKGVVHPILQTATPLQRVIWVLLELGNETGFHNWDVEQPNDYHPPPPVSLLSFVWLVIGC